MLQKIGMKNFKCFEVQDLSCAPLTVLCGLNGTGKSSVIQALLVLRQSAVSNGLSKGHLTLEGDLINIGTGRDVLFEEAKSDIIGFELCDSNIQETCMLHFSYSRNFDRLSRIDHEPAMEWMKIPPMGGNLAYVSAERIGPYKTYIQPEIRISKLGIDDHYTIDHLRDRQDQVFHSGDSRNAGLPHLRLSDVMDYWLQEVAPSAHLALETSPDSDAIIAGFSFDLPSDVKTRRYRTTNFGFGLSYVLPVLDALLSPAGTLCLIENPEAHLHPRGQTRLAELAVRASRAGVQVIVETHSDYFVDGIRIAVRNGLIPPDTTAFHYFERNAGKIVVSSPQLDTDGRLSSHPTGFLDQHEENMAKLIAPIS